MKFPLSLTLLLSVAHWALVVGEKDDGEPHPSLRRELQQVQQQLLDRAKGVWYGTWNPRSYRYNFEQECTNCGTAGYPWVVQMTGGRPARAVDVNGVLRGGALSVAQHFTRIENAIQNPNFAIEATYDETYGFPSTYVLGPASGANPVTSSISGFVIETGGSPQEQLTTSRRVWDTQKIRDYDFTYFVEGPNPDNIQWPLSVNVRNGSPVRTRDRNGNVVNFMIPMSFDQIFEMIQRQINKEAFVENEYSKRGFARDIHMTAFDIGDLRYHFCTFTDVGLEDV